MSQQQLSHLALTTLSRELDSTVQKYLASLPMNYRNDGSMENIHAELGRRMKLWLADWLKRARAEADKASMSDYLAPLKELDDTPDDYRQLQVFAERQSAQLQVAISKL